MKCQTLGLCVVVAVLWSPAGAMGDCLEKVTTRARDAQPYEATTCYPAADYSDHRGLWKRYLEDARHDCVRDWSTRSNIPNFEVASFRSIQVLEDAGMANGRSVDCACVTEVWADKSCYVEFQRMERSWYKGAVKHDGTHCMFNEVRQRQKNPSAAASGEWHQQCSEYDTPYQPVNVKVAEVKETITDLGKSVKSAASNIVKKVTKGGSTDAKDESRGGQDDSRDSFDDSRSDFQAWNGWQGWSCVNAFVI